MESQRRVTAVFAKRVENVREVQAEEGGTEGSTSQPSTSQGATAAPSCSQEETVSPPKRARLTFHPKDIGHFVRMDLVLFAEEESSSRGGSRSRGELIACPLAKFKKAIEAFKNTELHGYRRKASELARTFLFR